MKDFLTKIDHEAIERVRARAHANRQIVDEYNTALLREQGIEPTFELLQEMCEQNMEVALAAARRLGRNEG